MGAVRKAKLVDSNLAGAVAASGAFDFAGVTPKRVSFMVAAAANGAPGTLTLTVQVSPNGGMDLVDYDKLLSGEGSDAPVSSVAFSGSGGGIVSTSPEDVFDYIKVSAESASGDVDNNWDAAVYMVAEY